MKSEYTVVKISKKEAAELIRKWHYLGDKSFMFSHAYGLVCLNTCNLVGAAVFSVCTGIATLKSWFGLGNSNVEMLELIRLVVSPFHNGANFTSFLLGRSLRLLKKENVLGVISLADSSRHSGGIYRACNFQYYGTTAYKTYFYSEDGRLNPRGSTKNVRGVWLPRSKKHRYFFPIAKDAKPIIPPIPFATCENEKVTCCNNASLVFDSRFGVYYKCPVCFPSKALVVDPILN